MEGKEILGVRVGMTLMEIKSILGVPEDEGLYEEVSPPEYLLVYFLGERSTQGNMAEIELYFVSYTADSPTFKAEIYGKKLRDPSWR